MIAAAASGAQAPHLVPGFAYTIRVSSGTPASRVGISGGAGTLSYAGRAVFAGMRGRLDITEGSADVLFAKGDYILFDTTDIVIVHPAAREFFAVSRDAANRAADKLAALGITMTLSEEKVTLDSLGAGDTISGVPTRRYRMTVAFNMTTDAAFGRQRVATESVTDYWVGVVPGLPTNPLLRSNGFGGGGITSMFKSLSARVDSLSAKMGQTLALRTSAIAKVITGPGQVIETQQSSEVSELRRQNVDQSLLVLPANYKPVAMPGLENDAPAVDAGAKWKKLPSVR